MCTLISTILGTVATALSVASGMQASSAANDQAQSQAQYQADMAKRTAKAQEVELEKIKKDVAEGETSLRQEQSAKLGSQRSLLASQGYALSDTDGSAGSFIIQETGRNEEDALDYRNEGEHQIWRQENAAYEAQAKADQAGQKNERTRTSSLLTTGQSLIKNGQSVASSWYSYD